MAFNQTVIELDMTELANAQTVKVGDKVTHIRSKGNGYSIWRIEKISKISYPDIGERVELLLRLYSGIGEEFIYGWQPASEYQLFSAY